MARTPSQKAAVQAVKMAAKKLIEEIDRSGIDCTDFRALFHLDRSRWSDVETCCFHDQVTGQKRPCWETYSLFKSAYVTLRP